MRNEDDYAAEQPEDRPDNDPRRRSVIATSTTEPAEGDEDDRSDDEKDDGHDLELLHVTMIPAGPEQPICGPASAIRAS